MGKLIMHFCFALLAMTLVIAAALGCKRPGEICTSNDKCCGAFICNPWASRCTGGPDASGSGLWGPEDPPASVEWKQPAQ